MTEYTPTTEDVFRAASRYMSHDDLERWLAERDRQVAAESLEQAADAMEAAPGPLEEYREATLEEARYLRARAQAIREARND